MNRSMYEKFSVQMGGSNQSLSSPRMHSLTRVLEFQDPRVSIHTLPGFRR